MSRDINFMIYLVVKYMYVEGDLGLGPCGGEKIQDLGMNHVM